MPDLKEFLQERISAYLESAPEAIVSDTYALSVFASHQSDLGIQNIEVCVGVHTESQFRSRLARSGGSAYEARWNFLVWGDPYERFEWGINNYQSIIGVDRDHNPVGLDIREDWLRGRGILGLSEEGFDHFDDYVCAQESAAEQFLIEVAEACVALRNKGVISDVFGERGVLIAIHGVSDNFFDHQSTKLANPYLEKMDLGLSQVSAPLQSSGSSFCRPESL